MYLCKVKHNLFLMIVIDRYINIFLFLRYAYRIGIKYIQIRLQKMFLTVKLLVDPVSLYLLINKYTKYQ